MTTKTASDRLKEMDLEPQEALAPVANYVPYVRAGSLVFVSGQLPLKDGQLLHTGLVGDSVSPEEGQAAARQCALNIITQLIAACDGDLERIKRIVRLVGFVASGPDFTGHPTIINGASDLIVEVFGARGRHARAAVGCPSLPLNAPVEIEATAEIS